MPFRWLREIDGDDPEDILILAPYARPPQYGMDAEFVLPLSDQPLDFIDVQMCASSHWLLSSRADVDFTRTLCGEPVESPFLHDKIVPS
jgi:hypothetical protein